jgi:hypothetical protein
MNSARAWYRATTLATCMSVVVSTLPVGGCNRGVPPAAASQATPGSSDGAGARLALLDNSLRALQEGEREARRDRWDPAFVVERLGRDPHALLAWVRDQTSWVPYRGVLRGPTGVLMDRSGNSLDRALLLASLLEKSGQTVRLAHGELPAKQAIDLLPGLIARRKAGPSAEGRVDGSEVKAVAAQYQLDGSKIERAIDVQHDWTQAAFAELQTRVADQTTRLLASVARPDADAEWLARATAALVALRDHWWVQRQTASGWSDLDPLAAAGTNSSLVAAQDTMPVNGVPTEFHHQVVVRVIAERWANGPLKEARVLEQVLRPSELFGRPVVLQFWPGRWPVELNPDPNSPSGVRSAALEQRDWSASLAIGADVVAHADIAAAVDGRGSAAGNPFGALGGSIGALPRTSRASSTTRVGELTAVWIEYEVRAPRENHRTIRRVVFDLIGPALRAATVAAPAFTEAQRLERSLALTTRTDILTVPCELAPDFVTHLVADSILGNQELLRAAARDEITPADQRSRELLSRAGPVVSPLFTLALARAAWGRGPGSVFVDRPGIFSRHRSFGFDGQVVVLREANDIVANEVGVTLAERDAFPVRLEQGVLDTNAEAVLHTSARGLGNTGDAFLNGQPWVTLTPGNAAAASALKLPADAQRAIAEQLERGFTVVAPAAPVRNGSVSYIGWWRIDPATGDALGLAANGWGQSMSERGVQYNAFVEMAKTFAFQYAFCQAVPEVANQAVIFLQPYRDELPAWLPPLAMSQDPGAMYRANKKGCLIGAMIATGVTATLPMLLGILRMYGARFANALGPFMRDQRGGIRIPPGLVKQQVRGGPPVPEPAPGARGPIPERGLNPFGNTQADPSRTQFDPGSAPPRPPAPPSPSPTPMSPEAARAALKQAVAESEAASDAYREATSDYLRYAQRRPGSAFKDWADNPGEWDPTTDEALKNESWLKAEASREAIRKLEAAQQAAAAAQQAARQSGGAAGPVQGCQPVCGTTLVGLGAVGGGS